MLTRLFLRLTDYAIFRRLLWKPIYELLSKRFTIKDWSFMNYGYASNNDADRPVLKAEDESNRYSIQLYHHLATKIQIAGLSILEVGSGRGGGSSYIKNYLKAASIVGVDIAGNAVKMANQNFSGAGIAFVQGDAEHLPFKNDSFDVVFNVESSHTYGSIPVFLSEVKRVLRVGGYFLCADIRTSGDMEMFKQQISACGLQLIQKENISDNVRWAIELEEPIKQQRIRENIPPILRRLFRQFAGVKGSQAHIQLQNGKLIYYAFVLKKCSDHNR